MSEQGRATLVAIGLSVVLSVVVATLVAGWILGGTVNVSGPTAAGGAATVVVPHHRATRSEHPRSTAPATAPNVRPLQPPGSLFTSGGSAPTAPPAPPVAPSNGGPTGQPAAPACLACSVLHGLSILDVFHRLTTDFGLSPAEATSFLSTHVTGHHGLIAHLIRHHHRLVHDDHVGRAKGPGHQGHPRGRSHDRSHGHTKSHPHGNSHGHSKGKSHGHAKGHSHHHDDRRLR